MRTARMLLSGLALLICLLPLSAAEVELVEAGTIDIGLLIPIIAASIGTVTLWQWILPLSLGNLQVAFEVDDVDVVYALLRDAGYGAINPPVDVERDGFAVARAMYGLDPDGISIEIFQEFEDVIKK